jgi:hypothetical protein
MNEESHSTVGPFIQRIDTLDKVIQQIYGTSSTALRLQEQCRAAQSDILDMAGNRGLAEKVIAVIGHKNAGKSTFCRLLLDAQQDRDRIPAGTGEAGSTTRIQWIGSVFPSEMELEYETEIPIPKERMADLGSPYALVDVPGYGDSEASARLAAERALRMASTAVLVSDWDRIEDASQLDYLSQCDGAWVIPVIVARNYNQQVNDPRLSDALVRFHESLRQRCPSSNVRAPLLLPRISQNPELSDSARTAIIECLKEIITLPTPSLSRMAGGRFDRLKKQIKRELLPFITKVKPHFEALLHQEQVVAKTVATELMGDERQVFSKIRIHLLTTVAEQCPPAFFPFRTFLGIFALAAGAWDRLILALFGSLPSFAMVALQSGKNLQQLKMNREEARAILRQKATALATNQLVPANHIFLRSIRENLPDESKARFAHVSSKTTVTGLSEIESSTDQIFHEKLKNSRPHDSIVKIMGVISMLIWISLAVGPTWAIYREYFDAWGLALSGATEGTWNDFPTPAAGMIFSSLMLIFAPVFLLAMVTVSLSVSHKRVRQCADDIWKRSTDEVESAISNNVIRLETDDEMRIAVRRLFFECNTDSQSTSEFTN